MHRVAAGSVVLALMACGGGGGGHSITKVDFSEKPRAAGGMDRTMYVYFTCPKSDKQITGALLPTPAPPIRPETFSASMDPTTGKGIGSHELLGGSFALATSVQITCGDGTKLSAPVSIKPHVYKEPGGRQIIVTGTPLVFYMDSVGGGAQISAAAMPGFSFEVNGVKAVTSGDRMVAKAGPPASSLAKMTTAQVMQLVPATAKVTYKLDAMEGSVEFDELKMSMWEPLVQHAKNLVDTLEPTAKQGDVKPGPGKTVLFWNGLDLDFFGPAKPIEAIDLLVHEKIVSKGKAKNCGTYTDAAGNRATFTVHLKDSKVTVYDLATRTIVATKTYAGTGSCPKTFLSKNGQSASSGGYAASEQIEAYAKTFAN